MKKLFIFCFLGFFATALVGCSKEFSPLFEKAKAMYQEKRHIEVVDTLNLALPLWDEDDGTEKKAQALQLLGHSYKAINKVDKATEAYEQAIKLSNDTFEAAYELGTISLTSSKYNLAAKAFQDALRMKKDDPMSLVGLGNAYYGMRSYQNAIVAYQRVIDASPGVRQALEGKSFAAEKLKKQKKKRRRR